MVEKKINLLKEIGIENGKNNKKALLGCKWNQNKDYFGKWRQSIQN